MLRRFIENLENALFGPGAGFLAFSGIVLLRGVLEGALENARNLAVQSNEFQSLLFLFMHQYFFYASAFLGIVVVLAAASRERIEKTARAVLFFFPVILSPPLVDALFFGGGLDLSYLPQAHHIAETFVHFFNFAHPLYGVTPGMRVEIGLVLVGGFVYIMAKRRNLLLALLAPFLIYSLIILVLGGFPGLLAGALGTESWAIFKTGGLLLLDTQKYGMVNLIVATVLLAGALGMWRPGFVRTLALGTRPMKKGFYLAMAVVGVLVGKVMFSFAYPGLWKNPFDWLAVLGLLVCVGLAYLSAVLLNDFYDLPIDEKNEKRTSITSRGLKRQEALVASAGAALLGGFWALALGWPEFLLYAVLLFLSFAYSAPPLRLKRVPLVASFTLAVFALFCSYMGFSLFAKEKAITTFPPELVAAFLLGITLSFNLKDRTDLEGDRAGGVKTLFVLLGRRAGAWATSVAAGASLAVLPLILGTPAGLWVSVPGGVLLFLLGMRKRYREGFMWILVLFYAVGVGWFYYPKLRDRSPSRDVLSFGELMQGEQFYRQRENALALSHYLRAMNYRPLDDPWDYLRAAKAGGEAGELEVAQHLHEEAEKRFPTCRRAYSLHARLLFSLEDPDAILALVARALDAGCYTPDLAVFAGLAKLWKGQKDEALDAFLAAAATGEPGGLFLAYLAARDMGRPSLAYRDMALRRHADPDDAYPFFVYYLLKQRKDKPLARSVNAELLRLKPGSEMGAAFLRMIP